jgi:hypothetical protein
MAKTLSMRIFSILAVAFLVGIVPAHAQSDQTTDPPAPVRNYKLCSSGDEIQADELAVEAANQN